MIVGLNQTTAGLEHSAAGIRLPTARMAGAIPGRCRSGTSGSRTSAPSWPRAGRRPEKTAAPRSWEKSNECWRVIPEIGMAKSLEATEVRRFMGSDFNNGRILREGYLKSWRFHQILNEVSALEHQSMSQWNYLHGFCV